MKEWRDERQEGRVKRGKEESMEGWKGERTNERTNERTKKRRNEGTNEGTDERTKERTKAETKHKSSKVRIYAGNEQKSTLSPFQLRTRFEAKLQSTDLDLSPLFTFPKLWKRETKA